MSHIKQMLHSFYTGVRIGIFCGNDGKYINRDSFKSPVPLFYIEMPSYQYRKSHFGGKTLIKLRDSPTLEHSMCLWAHMLEIYVPFLFSCALMKCQILFWWCTNKDVNVVFKCGWIWIDMTLKHVQSLYLTQFSINSLATGRYTCKL